MNFKFNNKKITGILSIVPKNTVKFEEEIDDYNFSKKQSMKLKKIMGYGEHRIAKKDTCVSDLYIFWLRYILNEGLLRKNEIDALILVTSTPDYFMFHLPNKFMLERLADKMEINYDKMHNNIVGKFGNSNGVTIPVNLTYNLGDKLMSNSYTICLAGFRVGLAWSSMLLLQMGGLRFCKMIEY